MSDDCGCGSSGAITDSNRVPPVINTSTCEGVTISTLQVFYKKLRCVSQHDNYVMLIGVSKEHLTYYLDILEEMMRQKQMDPATCYGIEHFQAVQHIVQTIIVKSICL
jgi:hypothetical protein